MNRFFSLILFLFFPSIWLAQVNLSTNSKEIPQTRTGHNSFPKSASPGFTCTGNTFFANTFDTIYQFTLNGNTVAGPVPVQWIGASSLAHANSINGGTYSPTFYSTNGPTPTIFDGQSWTTFGNGTIPHVNNGGYGNYLYYMNITSSFSIRRFNGQQDTVIYSTYKGAGVADLAVDPAGNVYFLTAIFNPGNMTDSLYVISPTGQILIQHAYQLNRSQSYGSFYMNGTYYIGFGSANPVMPNSLLPLTVTATSVVAGNTIAMPAKSFFDLAACSPNGLISEVKEFKNVIPAIYPNPMQESAILFFDRPELRKVELFDLCGKLVQTEIVEVANFTIERKALHSGIYILKVTDHLQVAAFVKLIVE
jgi:hypothetical protein